MQTTCQPSSTSRSHRCDPTNPAPPATTATLLMPPPPLPPGSGIFFVLFNRPKHAMAHRRWVVRGVLPWVRNNVRVQATLDTDGYTVLRQAVAPDRLRAALRMLNL